jgi:hypothetical protein
MELKNQISPEFVSLFSNKDFIETVKGLSLYLAHENEEFRADMKAALFPDVEEIIETKIKESYTSPEFEAALDTGLSTLDIFRNVPRRVKELEVAVGIRECDPDEIKDYAVPVRIKTLEDKLDNMKVGTSEKPAVEIKLKSKTGRRAMALIKALMDSKKGHLTRSQIKATLSNEKDEELGDARITEDSSNPRRDIIDAINTAKKLCSKVLPDKKGYGRHEWRLVLRS